MSAAAPRRPVPEAKPRKRARDEEIVALLVKVVLDEGTIASQTRLAQLVNRQLARRGMRVTAERIRVLAVTSGLVRISVRTRVDGSTPDMDRCPVCRARLKRTANKTLTGTTTQTGYRCTRCPWWTGRELRIPQHYVFQARVGRTEKGQLTFAAINP
jgi:uncharacterized protein with PIN domain